MLEFTSTGLGKRQQELNCKVLEAVKNNEDFDKIKNTSESGDVDKFFKIDLASKYKNIEFMIEVLKSGDALHIQRVLKSRWLYDDEYSYMINTDYLHHNLFPHMSLRMQRKLLSTISVFVKDEKRVNEFYTYCLNSKLNHLASKFFVLLPESFKLKCIEEDKRILDMAKSSEREFLIRFIGNSFQLARLYLERYKYNRERTLHNLRYLYNVSEVQYLDMVQDFIPSQSVMSNLGLRISKDIMKKHKERIVNEPSIYLKLVNDGMLVKFSQPKDAKAYILGLLPIRSSEFWACDFCNKYKHIIEIIPPQDRFSFIKKSFIEKYPGVVFEMSLDFYNRGYYYLMTHEEQEMWALSHIEGGKELLGSGQDFLWYKFVNFDDSFKAIKKYIRITKDENLRAEMICILRETAKTHHDLETLLNYYYERHINEAIHNKECFVRSIIQNYNVYKFDEECWLSLNKMFHSLEVYNNFSNWSNSEFKTVTLVYHIIHNKDVPEALLEYIDLGIYFYEVKVQTERLTKEQEELVFKFLFNAFLEKINEFDKKNYSKTVKEGVRKYLNFMLDLLSQFKKEKHECPDVVNKFIKRDYKSFEYHMWLQAEVREEELSEKKLIRLLKEDSKLILEHLPSLKQKMNSRYCKFRLNILLKNIRLYYTKDLRKEFLDFFKKILSEPKTETSLLQAAVYGIMTLADENYLNDFLSEYAPKEAKVDHSTIDRQLLHTQKAICNYICVSRPPIPLNSILMYLKGDYVHSCLPLFHFYKANLPLSSCIEFVQSLIEAPLSIQKHGLRMAFECFSTENLKILILNVWKKTKNTSLRELLYKAVHTKLKEEEDVSIQDEYFELLKTFTLELHEDDIEELFKMFHYCSLPKRFINDYLDAGYKVVSNLPRNISNINRQRAVVDGLNEHIRYVDNSVLEPIIDDHVHFMLDQNELQHKYEKHEVAALYRAKWELTAKYTVYLKEDSELSKKKSLACRITTRCIDMWKEVKDNIYVFQEIFNIFLNDLECFSYIHDLSMYSLVNVIFGTILDELESKLPVNYIFLTVWDLRLSMLVRNVIVEESSATKLLGCFNDYNILLERCTIRFVKGFCGLLKEFMDKSLYYDTLFGPLKYRLKKYKGIMLDNLLKIAPNEDNNKTPRILNVVEIDVLICSELVDFNRYDMMTFSLRILPSDYSGPLSTDYLNVISKLKSFDSKELQCLFHEKFVNNDFKYRPHFTLK